MLINLKVTSRCNYTCGMCPFHGEGYSADYFGERPEWKRDMTLQEVEEILKKAQDAGVQLVDLTPNGEFFTYKKWREVLSLIQKYKMKAQLTTNGGLLKEEDIKDAVDLGIFHVAVSIDSVNYDTYKIVRKPASKQAFENAIHAPILFKQYGDAKNKCDGGGLYVQVQFIEQFRDKKGEEELRELLAFYQPHKLNQISVNKMFVTTKEGISYKNYDKQLPEYVVGTCKSYGGSYLIQTDGSVLGCCGEFYFYPQIKDKIPNVFKKSLKECKEQSNKLYLKDPIFIEYCKNCSLYAVNNEEVLERKFIHNGYFAMQYATQTRYFVIPEYLKGLREDILLFMYEKGYVGEIKKFASEKVLEFSQ